MLGYKLAFSQCLGQALDYEITATCGVSVGECLRGHANEYSVRSSEKVVFRPTPNFLCSLRIDNMDVYLPS